MPKQPLPLPPHYDAAKVGTVYRVPYQQRAAEARAWAAQHGIAPASADTRRICFLGIDVQNTFCTPEFELFVAGASGRAAVDDNVRLTEFLYRNLPSLTAMAFTLDTHYSHQIFHASFWIDADGNHPDPYMLISHADVRSGRWRVNPAISGHSLRLPGVATGAGAAADGASDGPDAAWLHDYALHYTAALESKGRYELTIWPYHAMLGGIGHALVSAVEEAAFFHGVARGAQIRFESKGAHPLTENYSACSAEVEHDHGGTALSERNTAFIDWLSTFDAVIIAGQAMSHCVAWTIADLLAADASIAPRLYVLEDCTSPIVAPGLDYREATAAAFAGFVSQGVNVVRSTDPISTWPGLA